MNTFQLVLCEHGAAAFWAHGLYYDIAINVSEVNLFFIINARIHNMFQLLVSCSYDNTIKMFKEDADGDDWSCVTTLGQYCTSQNVFEMVFGRFHHPNRE